MKISRIVFLFFALMILGSCDNKSKKLDSMYPLTNAPEINTRFGWVNTDKEYSIKDFRGKIVLLDFWTYGCINCQHIIPDLERLESEYRNELVVIGVHSAKFDSEKGTDKINDAIKRLHIKHPVVNDADFTVWNHYGIHAWPTVVLIDPNGKIIGHKSGENFYDLVRHNIEALKKEFGDKINTTPFSYNVVGEHDGLLRYPSKITVADDGSIYIADSGNNRVLKANSDGKVQAVIGSGKKGAENGKFSQASFYEPHGLAVRGHILYVADTKNNLIRKVDLDMQLVETAAGSGAKGYYFYEDKWGEPVDPNSPWDLLVDGNTMYIASAGNHQILKMELLSEKIYRFAGNGREALVDGALQEASFNQPSGIAIASNLLYVADAEASAVREINLHSGRVVTSVGKGLFDFGDRDGLRGQALFQHNTDIAASGDKIYIADTYNGKIKVLDVTQNKVYTLLEGLKEPEGIALAGNILYIADTNNHKILQYSIENDEVEEFELNFP